MTKRSSDRESQRTVEQLAKFKQAAREHGCDDDPKAFEDAVKRVATAPKPKDEPE